MRPRCDISNACVLNVCKTNGYCIVNNCSIETKKSLKDFVETGLSDTTPEGQIAKYVSDMFPNLNKEKTIHKDPTPTKNQARQAPERGFNSKKGTCHYCKTKLSAISYKGLSPDICPTVDHVMPTSLGGSNRAENKVWACSRCNSDKGSLLLEWWVAKINIYWPDGEKKATVLETVNGMIETLRDKI